MSSDDCVNSTELSVTVPQSPEMRRSKPSLTPLNPPPTPPLPLKHKRPPLPMTPLSMHRSRADTPVYTTAMSQELLKEVMNDEKDLYTSRIVRIMKYVQYHKSGMSAKNLYITAISMILLQIGICVFGLVIMRTDSQIYFIIPSIIACCILLYVLIESMYRSREVNAVRFMIISGITGVISHIGYLYTTKLMLWRRCYGSNWFDRVLETTTYGQKIPNCNVLNIYWSIFALIGLIFAVLVRLGGSLRVVYQNDDEDEEELPAEEAIDLNLTKKIRARGFNQLLLMYMFVILAITVAYFGDYADLDIGFVPIHLYVILVTLEYQRANLKSTSYFPLFLNMLPSFIITGTSCNIRQIITLIFFFSTILIQLQLIGVMEKQKQRKRMKWFRIYTVTYALFMYPLAVGVPNLFHRYNYFYTLCRPSNWTDLVNTALESIVIVTILVVGIAFSELQSVAWKSMRQRLKLIKILGQKTSDLSNEVAQLKSDAQTGHDDLDLPIKKAMDTIRDIMSQVKNRSLHRSLQTVLSNLSMQNVYEMDSSEINPGIIDWLPDEIAKKVRVEYTRHDSRTSSSSLPPEKLIADLHVWNVDVFDCDNYGVLESVAVDMIHRFDLESLVDLPKFSKFAQAVESRYHSNAYHNKLHAVDVTLVMGHFMNHGLGEKLGKTEKLAAIVASLIHDVDHPGHNNGLEVATSSYLAILHSDASVLEHHHLQVGFNLMSRSALDFLEINPEKRKWFRKLVIAMVLATDMADHFSFVGKFTVALASSCSWESKDNVLLLLQTALKTADISNPTKVEKLAVRWSARVMCEFWRQGDLQRKHGLDPSPFFDREKRDMCKCQIGFIDYVVSPLFKSWTDLFPFYSTAIDEMNKNRMFWKSMSEEEGLAIVKRLCPVFAYPDQDIDDSIRAYSDDLVEYTI